MKGKLSVSLWIENDLYQKMSDLPIKCYKFVPFIINYLFLACFGRWLTVFGSDGKRGDYDGGMAEWLKAAVLKTVERKFRGFESYFLRHLSGEVTERPMVLAC